MGDLGDILLVLHEQDVKLLLSILQLLDLVFLTLTELVVHLLYALIDDIKVFAEAAQSFRRIRLELLAQLVHVDIHPFVGQPHFVEHAEKRRR